MFTKKQYSILILLVVILIGGVFLFRERFDKWPWQGASPTASPIVTSTPTPSNSSASPEAKEPREVVMEDAAVKIAQISPVEPVLGGKWYVNRFWFIDGSYSSFYVEYEDGHIMRRVLLTADTSQAPANIAYHVDAYFEPGDSDWILKTGKDQKSGLSLILYEYDQNLKRWTKRN
ncbi:MAG: hypothetical protein UW72_C0009G0022 [Parcubacteria group bacterium GW2011_GWF2_44_7]|nr:MAG: hypothetical protein UW72_C0009G0022 [Parcubacteria group bacterium GW2011_GWF2_44_7]